MTRAFAPRFSAVVATLALGLAANHLVTSQGTKAVAADKATARPPVSVGHPSMESPQFNPIAVSAGGCSWPTPRRARWT